jgi:hypothetical protein
MICGVQKDTFTFTAVFFNTIFFMCVCIFFTANCYVFIYSYVTLIRLYYSNLRLTKLVKGTVLETLLLY